MINKINTYLNQCVTFYERLKWEYQMLLAAGALSLVIFLIIVGISGFKISSAPLTQSRSDITTMIPRGHVLVPIEVENYEALDSILGPYGVVDLLTDQGPVASNVRILRAPQNPSNFAVLVSEASAHAILKKNSSFRVIVKSINQSGTEIVVNSKNGNEQHGRRKIIYDGEL